jgi:hypothetical protein
MREIADDGMVVRILLIDRVPLKCRPLRGLDDKSAVFPTADAVGSCRCRPLRGLEDKRRRVSHR